MRKNDDIRKNKVKVKVTKNGRSLKEGVEVLGSLLNFLDKDLSEDKEFISSRSLRAREQRLRIMKMREKFEQSALMELIDLLDDKLIDETMAIVPPRGLARKLYRECHRDDYDEYSVRVCDDDDDSTFYLGSIQNVKEEDNDLLFTIDEDDDGYYDLTLYYRNHIITVGTLDEDSVTGKIYVSYLGEGHFRRLERFLYNLYGTITDWERDDDWDEDDD